MRSPKRTATTANALLIGLFLATLVAVAGASIRDFAIEQVNALQSADYVTVDKGSLDDLTTGIIAVLDTGDGKVPNVGGTVTVKDSRGKDVELR